MEGKLGRPPIGKVAMTPAERQQKRREIVANKAREKWKPPKRRWRANSRMTESTFFDRLTYWLATADDDDVARFLAHWINSYPGRGERIAEHVKTLIS
jgi:hypothetical protein